MNILVIGSGAREQAISWALASSKYSKKVFVLPGNAGNYPASFEKADEEFKEVMRKIHSPVLDTGFESLANFVEEQSISFTVVGPELPLVGGIVDFFEARSLRIIGPSTEAARLEGSKSFAKSFMLRHDIPTANYNVFDDLNDAISHLKARSFPSVIKKDGLAAGKGVVIVNNLEEAERVLPDFLSDGPILVEDFLEGREMSFIVFSDGMAFKSFVPCQDFKRALDGDRGGNTGGMGSYAPLNFLTPDLESKIIKRVVDPTLKGMFDEGRIFRGFLYLGLMVSGDDIWVLEYNVRLGDPEAQVIMATLDCDFLEMCESVLSAGISSFSYSYCGAAVNVVLVADPYPLSPRIGEEILGLSGIPIGLSNGVLIFHAGTKVENSKILTNGGRVLSVLGVDDNLEKARALAYENVEKIQFLSKRFRKDIAEFL